METPKEEPTAVRRAIAEELQVARVRAGLTRDELAARSGVSRASVFRIENAERDVKMEQLWALAEALNVEPVDILQAAQDLLRKNK